MNLFRLHDDPKIAAEMNCDKHVCKIVIEAAQLLCEAYWAAGQWAPYRTHSQRNNPIAVWTRATRCNFDWTLRHGLWLSVEYAKRYGRTHKTHATLAWCLDHEPPVPDGDQTPFPPSVPQDCREGTVVEQYRTYYLRHKQRFARWRNGAMPDWYCLGVESVRQEPVTVW